MTSTQFKKWLAAMKLANLGKSDAECARLLGMAPNSIVKMKRDGADQRTALACAALLAGIQPYEGETK